MAYQGSCHCGKTTYAIDGEIDKVHQCNCSLCSRRGYLLWFIDRSQLHLNTPESALKTYTFNKHHIQHQFCPDCGCAPFALATDKQGVAKAGINVRCLDGVDLAKLTVIPVDGRSF